MSTKEYNQAVADYADRLYRFIYSNCKNRDIAKDVVQDTFEKFWLKKDDVNSEKIKSYLFTTAYHTFVDYTRKNKRIIDFSEVNERNHLHYQQYSDLNEILHQVINQLPEDQRSVVLLRDYEGYSYEEIAEITNLSLAQVKVYIFRARTYLKSKIGNIENVA